MCGRSTDHCSTSFVVPIHKCPAKRVIFDQLMKKVSLQHSSSQSNNKNEKRDGHQGFPRGHPPQYWPGPTMLDFGDRTGTGILTVVWPIPSNQPTCPQIRANVMHFRSTSISQSGINRWLVKARNNVPFRIDLIELHVFTVANALPVTLYIEKMSCLWLDHCASQNNRSLRRNHLKPLNVWPWGNNDSY